VTLLSLQNFDKPSINLKSQPLRIFISIGCLSLSLLVLLLTPIFPSDFTLFKVFSSGFSYIFFLASLSLFGGKYVDLDYSTLSMV
jgi:hypothetical protein